MIWDEEQRRWSESVMTLCSRCDRASRRVVRCYWQPDAQLCPACCIHVAEMYDHIGWPPIEVAA